MIANAIESERASHIAKLNEIRAQYEENQERVSIAQASVSDSLRQYGIAATTQLQLFYRDLCAKQTVLKAELEKLSSMRFSPDRLLKEKTAAFIRLKSQCAEYMAESAERAEHWISRFVNRIHVSLNYRLIFDPVPEIKEFVNIAEETYVPVLAKFGERCNHSQGNECVLLPENHNI